jgi:hypothetical protein
MLWWMTVSKSGYLKSHHAVKQEAPLSIRWGSPRKNPNVGRGELVVENQSLPYRYPSLVINIDVRHCSYEHYIELVRKEKINLHGLYGKT